MGIQTAHTRGPVASEGTSRSPARRPAETSHHQQLRPHCPAWSGLSFRSPSTDQTTRSSRPCQATRPSVEGLPSTDKPRHPERARPAATSTRLVHLGCSSLVVTTRPSTHSVASSESVYGSAPMLLWTHLKVSTRRPRAPTTTGEGQKMPFPMPYPTSSTFTTIWNRPGAPSPILGVVARKGPP